MAVMVVFGLSRSLSAQNLLRIAAVVNEDIISVVDLDQRLRITALSSGINLDSATRERLLPQVLRNLIDERLQFQHATQNSIRVNKRQIDEQVADISRSNNIPPNQLAAFFAQRGIDVGSLRQRVEAELAWQEYIRRHLARQAQVSDEEIEEEIQRRQRVANLPQKRVAELFLSVDSPDRISEVMQNAQRLLGQIRSGANFAAMARNFSQSATARNGGDLGWVFDGQLPEELSEAIRKLRPGMVSAPIQTLTGVYILYVLEERVGQPSSGGTNLSIAQLTVLISKANEPTAFAEKKQELDTLSQSVDSCDSLQALAERREDANFAKADGIAIDQLPANVRIPVAGLSDNQVTRPIETPAGLILVARCGSDTPTGPDRRVVRAQLLGEQLERLAQRTLRDLRRDAFIDIRL